MLVPESNRFPPLGALARSVVAAMITDARDFTIDAFGRERDRNP